MHLSRLSQKIIFRLFSTLSLLLLYTNSSQAQSATFPRYPALSPDGETVAFCYGGDLWTVSAQGGQAQRLTSSLAYEHSPRFSPDGKWLAFSADRAGNDDIYIIPSAGGQSRQLTFHESDDQVCDWSVDSEGIIFSSRRDDRYADRIMIYEVNKEGGTPIPVMEAFGSEAVVSRDGNKILYTRNGRSTRWWRRHYKGSAASQVWLYDLTSREHIPVTDTTRLVSGDDYRRSSSRWSMWGTDNSIYMVAEPDDTPNIYRRNSDDSWDKITDYVRDGVRFPSISYDGTAIVYERGTDIFLIEDDADPRKLEITAPLDNPMSSLRIRYKDKANRLAFSPDGKQMFFEVRGEIFAGRIVGEDFKDARGRANSISGNNPARDSEFTVSPGGDSIIFVSDRSGNRDLYLAYSADSAVPELSRTLRVKIEQLTSDSADDHSPRWSPAGNQIAFVRGRGDLLIYNLASGKERRVISGWSMSRHTWSPDGKWIAFSREDDDYNSDIFILNLENGSELNVSQHPDEDTFPQWSQDGRKLAFRSRRENNSWNLQFVFLRLEDHYKTKAAWAEEQRKKPGKDKPNRKKKDDEKERVELVKVVIDSTEIFRRIRKVAQIANEDAVYAVSPDGKSFAFVGDHQGKIELNLVKWTGEDITRLTRDGSNPRYIDFTKDGKRIRYLTRSGKVKSVNSEGKKTENHPFDARVIVDLKAERNYKFAEIWRILNDRFYDSEFHGNDWAGLRDKYYPLMQKASCERDFGDLMNMMFGELNSSHMGYRSPTYGENYSTGRLGLEFDFENGGEGLLVKGVLPKGPCAIIEDAVNPGERLIAVDGVKLDPSVNLHEILQDQVGQRIELTLRRGKKGRQIVVRPMGAWRHGVLRYDEWVSQRRKTVEELSQGRLGYLHLRGMGNPSLATFEAELFSRAAGKDGLVIDVRYNGGGWTTDYILAMLQVKRHAVTFPRVGGPGYPQGRLPLYSWVKPVTVLCNEHSFSNAEIFSHSIKTLGRGKLVGVPTPGGVISAGGHRLLDGSSFRLPLRGWYFGREPIRDQKRNMEGNGAVPDIIVPLRPGQMAAGDDKQLKTAIAELLKNLKP